MKSRLHFLVQPLLLLVAFLYCSVSSFAQCSGGTGCVGTQCIGCFELDNVVPNVAVDPTTCTAELFLDPDSGIHFPDVAIDPTGDAAGSSISNITICNIVDNMGGTYVLSSPFEYTVAANTRVTIDFVVTSANGECEELNYNIDVFDQEPPVISGTPPMSLMHDCLADTTTVGPASITVTDDCSANPDIIVAYMSTSPPDQCTGGSFTRTWMAMDEEGNIASFTQMVTIDADDSGPTVTGTLPALGPVCLLTDIPAVTSRAELEGFGITISDSCSDDNGTALTVTSNDVQVGTGTCPANYVRTYTIADICGNEVTVQQNVVVDDTTSPAFTTIPQDETADCSTGLGSAADQFSAWVASGGNAVVSDNCTSAILIRAFIMPANTEITAEPSDALNAPCPNGTYTIRFEFSDECNTALEGTATYTIDDTNPPNITLGAADVAVVCDPVAGNDADLNAWLGSFGGAQANDICSSVSIQDFQVNGTTYLNVADTKAAVEAEIALQVGTCSMIGDTIATVEVQFTFVDACGNISTTDADYILRDNIAPIWTDPPSSLTFECDGTGNAADLALFLSSNTGGFNGAATDCSTITYTYVPDPVTLTDDCGGTGEREVTFTATDACGLATTATATITIEDTTPPDISSCPPGLLNLEMECVGAAANEVAANDWNTDNITALSACASDVCGGIGVTSDYDFANMVASCGNTGTLVVTYTISDDCGLSAEYTAILTIEDTTAPVATACPSRDATIICTGSGNEAAADTWNADNITALEACATDDCDAMLAVTSDYNFATLSDECGASGALTVTYTITDDCGMSTTFDATLTIEDNTAPDVSACASLDMVHECNTDAGNQIAAGVWNTNNLDSLQNCATDNCSGISVTTDYDYANFMEEATCGNTGSLTVNYTVSDACGNSTIVPAVFLIQDTQAPVFTETPEDVTFQCDGLGNMGEIGTWIGSNGMALVTDACSDVTVTNNFVALTGGCDGTGNTGEAFVTFTATDECGLSSTAMALIKVVDNISPVIMPTSSNLTIECDNSGTTNNDALQTWLNDFGGAETMDVCNSATWVRYDWITYDVNIGEGTVIASGSYTYAGVGDQLIAPADDCTFAARVDFVSIDDCGNPSTTVARFFIEDDTAPVITCPGADLVLECGQYTMADITPWLNSTTATDNCDNAITITNNFDFASLQLPCQGNQVASQLSVVFTAEDDCGNSTQCVAMIIIEDNTAPTITCPMADLVLECGQYTQADIDPWLNSVTAMDDCDTDIAITNDFVFGNLDVPCQVGTTPFTLTVTFTGTDDCGNSITCTADIVVEDNTRPSVVTPAENSSYDCSNNAAGGPDAAFDFWIEQIGFSSFAIDACTGIDNDADGYDGATGELTNSSWYAFMSGTASTPASLPAGVCPTDRTATVDFVVIDNCGNRDTTTATFTVIDNTPPAFLDCNQDITIQTSSDGTGDCAAFYTFSGPVVTDGCSTDANCSIALDPSSPFYDGVSGGVLLQGPANPNVIADPVTLIFSVPGPPTAATSAATLNIDFSSIDAEFITSTEFFFIEGEDGSILGQTQLADSQCGVPPTTTVFIPTGTFNQWSMDGQIQIRLVPNNPGAGLENEAVNNICPGGSTITASLDYDCSTPPAGFTIEYSVDGGTIYNPANPSNTNSFELGTNTVMFRATDCSGNSNVCSFNVTVEDDEEPVIGTCNMAGLPAMVASPDCSPQDFTLPRPSNVSDNCGVAGYDAPIMINNIFFSEHPNIDGFVMDTINTVFSMTSPPPPTGMATLEVMFKGDVDGFDDVATGAQEFLDIIGEDGSLIGTTAPQPDCAAALTSIGTFNISLADLTVWAADGTIDITIAPVYQMLAGFGSDGDWNNDDYGINPCVDPGTFNGTETDVTDNGNTMLGLNLSYQAVTVSYCVTGATTLESTFPSDGTDPTVSLNPGVNTINYKVSDIYGNVDSTSCVHTVTVGTPTLPSPNIALVNPAPSCPGDIVQLTDNSGNTGGTPVWTWYRDEAPTGSNAGEDVIIGTSTNPTFFFPAQEGTNTYYTIFSDNLCVSTMSNGIAVTVGALPTKPQIFASPNPVCEGDEFGLFIANPSVEWTDYEWRGSNAYAHDGQFPPIETATALATGNNVLTYILTVTSVTGCVSSDTALVIVNALPEEPTIESNSPVCDGENVILSTSTVCESYIWIGPDGNSAGTLTNPLLQTSVNNTTIPAGNVAYDAGLWSVICVNSDGCQSESGQIEVVISNPIAAAPSNTGPACVGDDVTLSVGAVSNAVSYSWTGPNGFESDNQNPVISSVGLSDEGTYSVMITDVNGCVGSGSTELVVSIAPSITAISVNPPAGTCVTGADNIELIPTVTPVTAGYTYLWTGPGSFSSVAENPILPNGTSADNGSYTLVVTNPEGCASAPITVVVDVTDVPNTPVLNANSTGLCEGEELVLATTPYVGTTVFYEWLVHTATGTTPISATTSPSLIITNVDENDSASYCVRVTVDGCTSNLSQIIPVTVSAQPTQPTVTGPSAVCEGEILQLETALINGATYQWTGPNGFNATVYNPSVFPATINASGAYTVQVTINECVSEISEPFNVMVNESPVAPTATNNGPICIDESTAMLTLSVTTGTAIPGATYEWFDLSTNNSIGTSGLSTNFNITDFSGYGEGVFDFYVVATANGCSSTVSVPTTVVLNTIPMEASFAGDDIQVCDGMVVDLDATGPTIGTGTWTQVAGPTVTIANPNAPNSPVNGLAGGNAYTFRWTLSNGACGDYSSDDVVVTVDASTQQAEAGSMVQECNTTMATLAATGADAGNTGSWSQSANQSQLGVVITDPSDPNTTVTGLVPGNTYQFTWGLSNVGCGAFSTDIVDVMVSDSDVSAFAGPDSSECGDGSVVVSATQADGCSGMWSSPDTELVIVNPTSPSTVVMDLKPGPNILVWTIDCGACGSSSDEVIVNFQDAPMAVTDVLVVGFNSAGTINVADNDVTSADYTVSIINDPNNGTLDQTSSGVYEYTHTGNDNSTDMFTYELCSTECPDVCTTADVAITVNVNEDCTPPTIFTPNNDGINDDFVVECLFASGKYPNNSVVIFNEWGDEVFRGAPYNNDWAGTYNGENLPVGTYYYVIDLGDGQMPLTGFLVLER